MGVLTCDTWLRRTFAAALALLLLHGCAVPSPQARGTRTMEWATEQGWRSLVLPGRVFDIQAFVPGSLQRAQRLTVYIEGDGLAWLDRHTPSFAPTPVDPLGFRLAVADMGAGVVYIARPCQYTFGPSFKGCQQKYWGSHRFAPEVIESMNDAVEQLRRRYGASELVLVGYSGGAAVAALLATRRSDVAALVTVAGTLDTDLWARTQRVSPLQASLNPKDVASRLASLPQWHFVGQKDLVVPGSVLTSFLMGASGQDREPTRSPVIQVMPGFDHQCCWAAAWPELSRRFAGPAAGH
ncbi:MAG: alpha/beta hydrolase [Hydrogenophaga sp.]|jgi:hypothetical protein|uniref:alpha/beta fold hydrolase n=1 Tax=Hydrogenophaga sp. TaxID=1904254 RepID=UPI00261C8361|nr:alpha/beta fold hydrolase [Hydrogenophaga sp.]MCV0441360.1 alpha/beta hydrolase [Hydrogenophaga sp.]